MVTQEQIEFFQTNGYLIAGPVLDDQELADARVAYDRIFNATEKPSSYRNLGQKEGEEVSQGAVLQIIDMYKLDDVFARILHKPAILDLAAGILGTPRIRLYHDQALFKPALHGDEVPWHQDNGYWKLDPPRAASLWIALDRRRRKMVVCGSCPAATRPVKLGTSGPGSSSRSLRPTPTRSSRYRSRFGQDRGCSTTVARSTGRSLTISPTNAGRG